jgi:ABC-type transport system involved in multi-copper enzyme maturation permease subunit
MTAAVAIARNSFREAVRDRILLTLVIFAVLMLGAAVLFTQMSFGVVSQALINFSLAAITFFGVLIAVFLGNQLVSKEIERRTAYTLLAHPVRRSELVLGKFFGLLLTLVVNCGVMMAGFLLVLAYVLGGWRSGEGVLFAAAWLIFLELALLTAISLLFSSFSSPVMAAIFSLSLFVIGNFDNDLRTLGDSARSHFVRWAVRVLSWVLPNFSGFNIVAGAAHFHPVGAAYVALTTLYAVVYTAAMLGIAAVILENRDL